MELPDEFPDDASLEKDGAELLGDLIRFDTTNPPGNETACANYLIEWLGKRGIPGEVIESAPGRGSAIARLKCSNPDAEPLLLLSHLDVVPAVASDWSVPPFSGELKDGHIFGRGALDCKGATAMQALALAGIVKAGVKLERDVILAATADEEAGGVMGVEWLLKNCREKFFAPYAINEGGGFSLDFRGKTYFTCQTAEKKICWIKLKSRGEPGHASMPDRDGAMNNMVKALAKLADHRAPVTKESRDAIQAMWKLAAGRVGAIAAKLATMPVVREWMFSLVRNKAARRIFEAMVTNTISITVVHGGEKANVIPAEVNAQLDCRLLPGMTHRHMLDDIQKVVGKYGVKAELDFISNGAHTETSSGLYESIESSVKSLGPENQLVPFMVTGATDGRFLADAGCNVYGFIPLRLGDKAISFMKAIHGIDESISMDNLVFGTQLIADVTIRFCK